MTKVPGVDFSSGSIGHALSNGAGMALGGRMSQRDFNVFVMLGDGEMQEGQVWEAALFAAHHKLSRPVAIIDRNGYQLDGKVDDVIGVEFAARQVAGLRLGGARGRRPRPAALTALLRRLRADEARERPACVIAKTIKGKGVSYMETEPGWHLGYLAPQDAQAAIDEIMTREI